MEREIFVLMLSSGMQVIGEYIRSDEAGTMWIREPRSVAVSPDFQRAMLVPFWIGNTESVPFNLDLIVAVSDTVPENVRDMYMQSVTGLQIASQVPKAN